MYIICLILGKIKQSITKITFIVPILKNIFYIILHRPKKRQQCEQGHAVVSAKHGVNLTMIIVITAVGFVARNGPKFTLIFSSLKFDIKIFK